MMTLKQIGEFGFIEKISRGCLIRPQYIIKSIGDDAAAFTTAPNEVSLVTTDLLVERIHFLRNATSGYELGYKSLAVNLSDIAAMGGTAREAFVSIAIPEDVELEYLESIYGGMKDLAHKFEVNILGGDTTGSKIDLIINVAVHGTIPQNEMMCRNAASPGDIIFSTGVLGDSKAGLHLILNNLPADSDERRRLIRAHLMPEPHLQEGRFLARQNGIGAAIDTSDGLSSDLGHIVEQSGVGATLHADQIPISRALKSFCEQFDFDPVEYALSGGEDYTLLCTVAPKDARRVARNFQQQFNRKLFRIGAINADKRLEIVFPDKTSRTLAATGWNHFKND
jgi:thiamine-monophosphate kinase